MGMKGIFLLVILLVLATSVFAAKVVPLPDLNLPNSIEVEGEKMYITDFQTVYIYSLKDLSLQKTFGRKGEGPGEFLGEIELTIQPEYIIIHSETKLSYYSKEGKLLKEVKFRGAIGSLYLPVGENFVAFGINMGPNGTAYETLNLYDPQLQKIKELYRVESWIQRRGPKKGYHLLNFYGLIYKSYDNKIFYGAKKGVIEVLDANGEKLYTITPEYEKIKVTEEDKTKYREFLKIDSFWRTRYETIKKDLIFGEYFPELRRFEVADKKIYIFTYKEKDGGVQCIVLDIKGKPLKKVFLPLINQNPTLPYPFTISEGKFYQLNDNASTETWELHVTEIK